MAAGALLTCMIPNIETAWDVVLYVMQLCGVGFVVTSVSHQLILYTGFKFSGSCCTHSFFNAVQSASQHSVFSVTSSGRVFIHTLEIREEVW